MSDVRVCIRNEWGWFIALGMAWHLDSGPYIIIDALLGWIYVAYKLAERFL